MGLKNVDADRWDQAVSETIRAERAARRLSQAEVARRSGISRASYIRYEVGSRTPNVTQVFQIAEALEISPTAFVRKIEERANS